jgi:hypothetical protein
MHGGTRLFEKQAGFFGTNLLKIDIITTRGPIKKLENVVATAVPGLPN